jgi:hypothetical protein
LLVFFCQYCSKLFRSITGNSHITLTTSDLYNKHCVNRSEKCQLSFKLFCKYVLLFLKLIVQVSQNIFLSPLADGPLQFKDSLTGDKVIEVKTVYGRSFSIVRIPYSLKLLIQELQVMNVQMRLITEENIDQLTSVTLKDKKF